MLTSSDSVALVAFAVSRLIERHRWLHEEAIRRICHRGGNRACRSDRARARCGRGLAALWYPGLEPEVVVWGWQQRATAAVAAAQPGAPSASDRTGSPAAGSSLAAGGRLCPRSRLPAWLPIRVIRQPIPTRVAAARIGHASRFSTLTGCLLAILGRNTRTAPRQWRTHSDRIIA